MSTINVHVFGLPEEAMDHDERLCVEPDAGEIVIFHVGATPIIQLGRIDYACKCCGATSAYRIPLAS